MMIDDRGQRSEDIGQRSEQTNNHQRLTNNQPKRLLPKFQQKETEIARLLLQLSRASFSWFSFVNLAALMASGPRSTSTPSAVASASWVIWLPSSSVR